MRLRWTVSAGGARCWFATRLLEHELAAHMALLGKPVHYACLSNADPDA